MRYHGARAWEKQSDSCGAVQLYSDGERQVRNIRYRNTRPDATETSVGIVQLDVHVRNRGFLQDGSGLSEPFRVSYSRHT